MWRTPEIETAPKREIQMPDRSQRLIDVKRLSLYPIRKKWDAPRVVASGEGGVAEQIIQLAWANDIKVREDADLVEILSAIDVESEIPIEAFAAVAEILSYVYRANAGLIPLEDSKDN